MIQASLDAPATASSGRAGGPSDAGIPPVPPVKPVKVKPLTLPVGIQDLRKKITNFDLKTLSALKSDRAYVFFGVVTIDSKTSQDTFSGRITDSSGRFLFLQAGPFAIPFKHACDRKAGRPMYLFGNIVPRGKTFLLVNPEPVRSGEIGALRPVFPLHQQTIMAQCSVEDGLLPQSYLAPLRTQLAYRTSLQQSLPSWIALSIEKLLKDGLKTRAAMRAAFGTSKIADVRQATNQMLLDLVCPKDTARTRAAKKLADRVAGVCILHDQVEELAEFAKRHLKAKRPVPTLGTQTRDQLQEIALKHSKPFGFDLTAEQVTAAIDILSFLNTGVPMRALLTGDVGSGKTAVFSVTAAAMLEAGHSVAVILPSEPLANQVHSLLVKWYPHFKPQLVAGANRPRAGAKFVVGTVAILTRTECDFDYVIVDEQQRFGTLQRNSAMADRAHQLESTATAIPRSLALADMGLTQVATLQDCHVKKNIVTRIWRADQRKQLFAEIHATVAAGQQVLVIYPSIASSTPSEEPTEPLAETKPSASQKRAAVDSYIAVWEKAFPGRVRICHGAQTPSQNAAAIADIRDRKADILASTTLVEVGIDIPSLMRVVIVQADCFGSSTLHQLRGRVARAGGDGYCDFYLPKDPRDISLKRLEMLTVTSNGFEIAEADCEMRGAGDISRSGQRQRGKLPESPFPGHEVPRASLLEASARLHREFGID